jgi:hypothetical protein
LVIQGGELVDLSVKMARDQAIDINRQDKAWKAGIAKLVLECPGKHGLPNLQSIVKNSDAGAAITASMTAAWTVALSLGILTRAQISAMRRRQIGLIHVEIDRALEDKRKSDRGHTQMLRALLTEYELQSRDDPANAR